MSASSPSPCMSPLSPWLQVVLVKAYIACTRMHCYRKQVHGPMQSKYIHRPTRQLTSNQMHRRSRTDTSVPWKWSEPDFQTQFHDLIHCGLHHPCNFLIACDYDCYYIGHYCMRTPPHPCMSPPSPCLATVSSKSFFTPFAMLQKTTIVRAICWR